MQIGINEWFVPQISEHCPKNKPGRLIIKVSWFNRPGNASALIPILGIVQAWITSFDDTNDRICVLNGKITRLSTSSKRNSFLFDDWFLNMNESNSLLLKFGYSYDQYHWCPEHFNDKWGFIDSSNKYRRWREGRAINIKNRVGITVQISSVDWLFVNLQFI